MKLIVSLKDVTAVFVIICLHAATFVSSLQVGTTNQNVMMYDNKVMNKYRLPNDTVPIHYNIKLDLNNITFMGETEIYLKVLRPTLNIVLHSNVTIDESETSVRDEDNIFKPNEHVYDFDTDMLHLRFNNSLNSGVYVLYLKFVGVLAGDLCGAFRSYYPDVDYNYALIFGTHFQKTSARRAFPCWDEPALKATFNVSLKHDTNYTALSNMPAYMMEHDESDKKVWTHFETTPVMSTNILAFFVVNYPNITNSDGTVRVWARRQKINAATYFLDIVQKATDELSRFLNSTVRVPKMDHVIIPHYSASATENWGVVVYAEGTVPYISDMRSIESRMLQVMTVTHEMVHQWFGNLVSPAWWKYFWLSEGTATYLKYYITDKFFKSWRVMDNIIFHQMKSFDSDDSTYVDHINRDYISPRITRGDYALSYIKPAMIFWMLTHILGENVYRAGLLNYISAHEYSSVTSDDLWEAMQIALNTSNSVHKDFQVKEVMDTWIEHPGYPMVIVTRNYTTGSVTIRQQPSLFSKDKTRIHQKWWIPINYATRSAPEFSATKPVFWLRPSDKDIVIEGIDVGDWIIVNLQHTGYYRVNYDSTNWRKIVKYLNTNDYAKIHAGNRVHLMDTAYNLMKTKQLNVTTFIHLTNYLHRETDPVVWKYVLSNSHLRYAYFRHSKGEVLKSHILGLMNAFIDTIDYETLFAEDDFSMSVKLEALNWACRFDHRECKEQATRRLIAYLNDPVANTIPYDAKYWVFCMGLARANRSIWDMVYQELSRMQERTFFDTLGYLSCTEDPSIIKHYLNLSLAENTTISKFTYPISILNNIDVDLPENIDAVIEFIMENLTRITDATNELNNILYNLIWKISRQDQMDKLKEFLRSNGINEDSNILYRERNLSEIDEELTKILDWLRISNITDTTDSE
ncbi:aminopeptidase N-like [Hylaeus volcanicus]|uniref:aminopeptidase N-like n=1 Tax=Hylaeus volcanicus TaxID=313075 RepID=UPI0023B7EB8D|nr:aminopeptidase N-like [Hylaeus volcanicus]XP_053976699.1 aminopeptidase N-like [Hylaeus volcanicus]XP_053976700.1 aminopeptidase N-like [Hylaeus volcanicus]XP_053976701.1 aminopeptidase N-like [Hylaeus volcanicus]